MGNYLLDTRDSYWPTYPQDFKNSMLDICKQVADYKDPEKHAEPNSSTDLWCDEYFKKCLAEGDPWPSHQLVGWTPG